MDGTRHEAAGGKEHKRQEPGIGREEQISEHPGPDPVHPEAGDPVAGRSPEELRERQERNMERGRRERRRDQRGAGR
ncbi:hypothetical protein WDV06_27165 [Streptomyces racemochromogenes]|uniref:Uncharacterized protein n=1 Tax=Streptomyces racemochromogenes TaxID=67353 RepID=A0ABW7PLA8_9ACTN